MNPALSPVPTPAQEALVALGNHCINCPQCRPTWDGDEPQHRSCLAADRLYEVWWSRFHARRRLA